MKANQQSPNPLPCPPTHSPPPPPVYNALTATAKKLADKPSFMEAYRQKFPHISERGWLGGRTGRVGRTGLHFVAQVCSGCGMNSLLRLCQLPLHLISPSLPQWPPRSGCFRRWRSSGGPPQPQLWRTRRRPPGPWQRWRWRQRQRLASRGGGMRLTRRALWTSCRKCWSAGGRWQMRPLTTLAAWQLGPAQPSSRRQQQARRQRQQV